MNSTLNKLGERLTELMFENSVSNKKLAEDMGVHVTTIQRWKRDATSLFLSDLLKLANYFHCSLDFLVGKSEKFLDYTPNECPPFYEQFRKIIEEHGTSRYRMDKETKFKDSYFTKWSKGADPHVFSLIELADYFNISIDVLIGRDR